MKGTLTIDGVTVEIWRPIVGYEGHYEVSSHGRVRSIDRVLVSKSGVSRKYHGQIRKQSMNMCGYPMVTLCVGQKKKFCSIHRLVAKSFIKNNKKYREVNHIDGDKTNNNVENLQWCTSSQNQLHAYDIGIQKRGKDSQYAKPVLQYSLKGEFIKKWECTKDAAEKLGLNYIAIINNTLGKSKTSQGFIWMRETASLTTIGS